MSGNDFSATFWGVRGSIACPGPDYNKYGGNTSCIEVRCGDRLPILDAGTGLRPLGVRLDQDGAVDADILFTHSHLDRRLSGRA
jgi:phosphoribosyl 1,2-cyclic phosphodiesterase